MDLDWTRALWIGSESVSQHAADLAGYVGVSLTNVSLSPNFQALKDFWSSHSEASVLPGIELLGKNPFIAAAHDAAWALLLAVHHVVKAGGSVTDGQAIRNALVNVSFIGASGEIAFNNDLDLKQGAYDVLAATSNAEGHTEIAARYRQGKLIVMDRDRLQARQVPSVDGRLCRMRCITPVYAGRFCLGVLDVICAMAMLFLASIYALLSLRDSHSFPRWITTLDISFYLEVYFSNKPIPRTSWHAALCSATFVLAWILESLFTSILCRLLLLDWVSSLPVEFDFLYYLAFFLIQALVCGLYSWRRPGHGWYLCKWVDKFGDSVTDLFRHEKSNTCSQAPERIIVYHQNASHQVYTHSLEWRWCKDSTLLDSGILHALPGSIHSIYTFQRLIYFRKEDLSQDLRHRAPAVEIAFEATRRDQATQRTGKPQLRVLVKFICTPDKCGLGKAPKQEDKGEGFSWASNESMKHRQILCAHLKDKNFTSELLSHQVGEAQLLIPSEASHSKLRDFLSKMKPSWTPLMLENCFGQDDESIYCIESPFPGEFSTLTETLSSEIIPLQEACRICLSVARLVDRLHKAGVTLGVLNSDAIVMGEGEPVIVEWSFARILPVREGKPGDATEAEDKSSKPGQNARIYGAPASFALEHLLGETWQHSRRYEKSYEAADMYSLGILLYRIIASVNGVPQYPFFAMHEQDDSRTLKLWQGQVQTLGDMKRDRLRDYLIEVRKEEGYLELNDTRRESGPVTGLKWKVGKPVQGRNLSTSGAQWKMAGAEKPTQGRELSNSELATALEEGRAEFTQKEWEAFGIDDLRSDDFIKAGDSFFKLAMSKLADMLVQKAAAGRKWKMAGAEKPTQGRELSNSELATALEEGRAEFTQKEWEAFGIDDLRSDDFIKAGDSFFVTDNSYLGPSEIEFTQGEWNALGIKDLCATDFIVVGANCFVPQVVQIYGCNLHEVKFNVFANTLNLPALPAERSLPNEISFRDLLQDSDCKFDICGVRYEPMASVFVWERVEPSGLKWERAGAEKPTHGRELSNQSLAAALEEGRTDFTQKEWDAFGIRNLRSDHFIKAGGSYFATAVEKPVEGQELYAPRLKEALKKKIETDISFKQEGRDMMSTHFDISSDASAVDDVASFLRMDDFIQISDVCYCKPAGKAKHREDAHFLNLHVTSEHQRNGKQERHLWSVGLKLSRLSKITLTDMAKEQADIKLEAMYFAFCYPIEQSEWETKFAPGRDSLTLFEEGGFIYFDQDM